MTILLDAPKLPEWLERYHSVMELASEGGELENEARKAVQPRPAGSFMPPTFDTATIGHWMTRVREASLPESKEFEAAATTIDAAEKRLSDNAEDRGAISEMLYALRTAVREVVVAAGSIVRSRGEDGVKLAIVSTMYHTDRKSSSAIIQFTDGTRFGIDDSLLSRFLGVLLDDDGYLEDRGGMGCVGMSEEGRRWFEQRLRGAAAQSKSDDDAVAWSDARREVDVVASRLGFMKNDDLREIAMSLLEEIVTTVDAGASLSTMILCGSLVETMLLDIAEQIPHKLKFATKPNWPEKVSLGEILKELNGDTVALVTDTAKGMAVCDHRDLVHPHCRRESNICIDPTAARAMTVLAALVARDLDNAANDGKIKQLKNA